MQQEPIIVIEQHLVEHDILDEDLLVHIDILIQVGHIHLIKLHEHVSGHVKADMKNLVIIV